LLPLWLDRQPDGVADGLAPPSPASSRPSPTSQTPPLAPFSSAAETAACDGDQGATRLPLRLSVAVVSPLAATVAERDFEAGHEIRLGKGGPSGSIDATTNAPSAGASPLSRCSASSHGPQEVPAPSSTGATPYPRQSESPDHASRMRLLEESARRLRECAEQVRAESRKVRLVGPTFSAVDDAANLAGSCGGANGSERDGASPSVVRDTPDDGVVPTPPARPQSAREDRRLQEMRRKIAELDQINELERKRLEEEQRESEARQRAQEEFERRVQLETERNLRELREKEEREARAREARDEAARRELEDRTRRRREQLREEDARSRNLEEKRREGRSEQQQAMWQAFEEELERQWAAQEAEERRRLAEYARERQRQYEEFDRRLTSERQRLASEAAFRAAERTQKVRRAANADEAFYGPKRAAGAEARPPPPPPSAQHAQGRAPPPPPSAPPRSVGRPPPPGPTLTPDECSILKELQAVRTAPRETQKAKVKDLLFRWHPDKNPACQDKAKQLFQFVQTHRELVLGL